MFKPSNDDDDDDQRSKAEAEQSPVDILQVDLDLAQEMLPKTEKEIDEQCTNEICEVQLVTEKQLPYLRRYFILEPPMFLVYLCMNLSATVYQNHLLDQACKVVFHYNDTACDPMLGAITKNDYTNEVENVVHPYVSRISMAGTLIGTIIPAVFSLFIGPWSDKFGRRPIMITTLSASVLGYVISSLIAAISLYTDVNPWLYIIGYVPSAIVGGNCAFMIMSYCYITDIAPSRQKATRMVFNDAALGAGTLLGLVLGGHLFVATNMAVVYGISALGTLLALIYICFISEESVKVKQCSMGQMIREFFYYKRVWQLIRTCFAKRTQHRRAFLWCTILALIITKFVTQGELDIVYLFFRKKFDISLKDFGAFNGISSSILIVGGILGVTILRKMLKISIVTMSLITLISAVAQSITRAVAQLFWEIYLGAGLGCLSGIISAMLFTILAFLTPPHETGAVFALTTALQTVSPLVAAPVYTEIYNATITFYPGLFNIVSASLYFICCVGMCIIYVVQRVQHVEIQCPTPPPEEEEKDTQAA